MEYLNELVDCSADAWSISAATATLKTQLRKEFPYELSSRLTQRGSAQLRNMHRSHSTPQYRAPRVPVGCSRPFYFSHHSAAVFQSFYCIHLCSSVSVLSTRSGCFSVHIQVAHSVAIKKITRQSYLLVYTGSTLTAAAQCSTLTAAAQRSL